MYPCNIVYEGLEFKLSEHLYYNKLDSLNVILNAKDRYAAKRVAKKKTVADNWEQVKVKIMKKVIHLKFDKNHNIRDRLLATKGFLYEASKGDSFSCGMSRLLFFLSLRWRPSKL